MDRQPSLRDPGRGVGWSEPDPDWVMMARSTRARLASASCLEDIGTKRLRYLYDFGDGWEHTIKVERLTDPVPGVGAAARRS